MSRIVAFVLDAATGRPAEALGVLLQRPSGGGWSTLAEGVTDASGRVARWLPAPAEIAAGEYRLVYATGAYYARHGRPCFHPEVAIHFTVERDEPHVLPLVLSPYGFTTYRGS